MTAAKTTVGLPEIKTNKQTNKQKQQLAKNCAQEIG